MSYSFGRRGALALAMLLALGWLPAQAAPSISFTISGAVDHPATYDLADLQALPSQTRTVTYQAGGTHITATFTGVSLWSLLDTAGIQTDPAIKNNILTKSVLATGSDGYQALFGLGELSPRFGNAQILVAYAVDGADLGPDGFARLVVDGDIAGGRFVSNLVDLHVAGIAITPLPGGLILLAPAIAGLMIRARQKSR